MQLTDAELISRLNRIADTANDNYGAAKTIRAGVERITALRAEVEQYKSDIEAKRFVKLPDALIAPYELNERYWVCGWDSEDCTLTIQDRALKAKEAASMALKGFADGSASE